MGFSSFSMKRLQLGRCTHCSTIDLRVIVLETLVMGLFKYKQVDYLSFGLGLLCSAGYLRMRQMAVTKIVQDRQQENVTQEATQV